MHLEVLEQVFERRSVRCGDLQAHPAGVCVRPSDLDVLQAVVSTRFEHDVEDLREQERVDDVTAELDHLGFHGSPPRCVRPSHP